MRIFLTICVAFGLMAFASPAADDLPPDWLRRPSGDDVASAYPAKALEQDVGGHVVILCKVSPDGVLGDCSVAEEDPVGMGFGEAALSLTPGFLMSPRTVNGQPTAGLVRIPINFAPTPETSIPSAEKMFAPIRTALTPAPRDAGGAAAGLAAVFLLFLLLDRRYGREGSGISVSDTVGEGLGVVSLFWRRGFLPLILFIAVSSAMQVTAYAPPLMKPWMFLLTMVGLVYGVIVQGSAWRLALSAGDPASPIVFKSPGFHLGKPELWAFVAPLVVSLISMLAMVVGALIAVAAWFALGAIPALAQEKTLIGWTIGGAGVAALLVLSVRLWLVTPVTIRKDDLALGEAWRATRGRLWPILVSVLLVELVLVAPIYATLILSGRLPPFTDGPAFAAPWTVIQALLPFLTVGFGLPFMTGMKTALARSRTASPD